MGITTVFTWNKCTCCTYLKFTTHKAFTKIYKNLLQGVDKFEQIVHNISVNETLKYSVERRSILMKIQKFEYTPINKQVFKAHSNNQKSASSTNKKVFYDMDSVKDAMATDSIDDPILPQIVRKFRESYNILFPAKVVKEAKNVKNQIDKLVDNHKFEAVA